MKRVVDFLLVLIKLFR